MRGAPIGWITTNWRLKLLSLVLAVGLLGGVAFSENPPALDAVPVRVEYANLPQDLVITNPTSTVEVPVAGFRGDIERYRRSAAGVSIDLSHAHAGSGQIHLARPRSSLPGLTFRQSIIPISLNIESLVTRQLDIVVQTRNKAAGIAVIAERTYATCGNANDHCQVSVTGPASVLDTLKAYVDYDVPITAAATGSSPNQPIQFLQSGHPIPLGRSPRTIPPIRWTPEVVTVQVTTQGGSQTKMVPVSVRVSGSQACGYQISGVEVQPNQVTVSGPVDAVTKITSVTMDAIPLAGVYGNQRFVRAVQTGSTTVTADPLQVVVNLTFGQVFSCAAPTPSAGAGPGPTPTPTPTPSPSTSP